MRRTIILLGFLPRNKLGNRFVRTRALSGEGREVHLEASVKGRDFDSAFSALKTELLKTDAFFPQLRRWKFDVSPRSSGWSMIPSGNLTSTPTMGQISYCVATQRFRIEGTRDATNVRLNPSGKGHAFYFKGTLETYVEGPCVRAMNKGLPFDFQITPDAKQMESLRLHDFGD